MATAPLPPRAPQVCGLVKSIEVPGEGGGRGAFGSNKPKCMYLLYIEAVSATNTKAAGKAASKEEDGDDALNLSLLDLHAIVEIAVRPPPAHPAWLPWSGGCCLVCCPRSLLGWGRSRKHPRTTPCTTNFPRAPSTTCPFHHAPLPL